MPGDGIRVTTTHTNPHMRARVCARTHTVPVCRLPSSSEFQHVGLCGAAGENWPCSAQLRPVRISSMTFLTAAPPHGGGTIFWPGAHKKLALVASSLPADGSMMTVAQACADACDGIKPVEVAPEVGDVLLRSTILLNRE